MEGRIFFGGALEIAKEGGACPSAHERAEWSHPQSLPSISPP